MVSKQCGTGKRLRRCAAIAMVALFVPLLRLADASGANAPDKARWQAVILGGLLQDETAVEASIGTGSGKGYDELLSISFVEYPLASESSIAARGRVYYERGTALGFATIYGTDSGILGRFLLDNQTELLFLGERSAIAAPDESCGPFRVVSAGAEETGVYLLTAELYGRMAAVGDLPSLPPKHGRKGYAA